MQKDLLQTHYVKILKSTIKNFKGSQGKKKDGNPFSDPNEAISRFFNRNYTGQERMEWQSIETLKLPATQLKRRGRKKETNKQIEPQTKL